MRVARPHHLLFNTQDWATSATRYFGERSCLWDLIWHLRGQSCLQAQRASWARANWRSHPVLASGLDCFLRYTMCNQSFQIRRFSDFYKGVAGWGSFSFLIIPFFRFLLQESVPRWILLRLSVPTAHAAVRFWNKKILRWECSSSQTVLICVFPRRGGLLLRH